MCDLFFILGLDRLGERTVSSALALSSIFLSFLVELRNLLCFSIQSLDFSLAYFLIFLSLYPLVSSAYLRYPYLGFTFY